MIAKIVRSYRKTVEFVIDHGKLTINAPVNLDCDHIAQLVNQHKDWITSKLQAKNNSAQPSSAKITIWGDVATTSQLFALKKVLIFGKIFDVAFTDTNKPYTNDCYLFLPQKCENSLPARKKVVTSYLKKMAKECLGQEISNWGSNTGLCPTGINILSIKGAGWISCKDTVNRVVTVDYRMVQLPFRLRNYLIAHLFTHFYQPVHDETFWNTLSNYLPNCLAFDKELGEYAFLKDI